MDKSALARCVAEMESIGRNCEFGLVQRGLGVEPISLLRWAGSTMDNIIDGIRNKFEDLAENMTGIAKPEWKPPIEQHWWLTCQRYGILFHTDQVVAESTVEEATSAIRKRLRWLAAKLLDDFRSDEKLFVWSNAEMRDPCDSLRLFAAIREIGPASLLAVAEDPEREVTTSDVYDGLIGSWTPKLTAFSNAVAFEPEPWHRTILAAHAAWVNRRKRLFHYFVAQGESSEHASVDGSDLSEGSQAKPVEVSPPIINCAAAQIDEIYTHFESLGNNCELGIVQRKAGYDAPGLFRNVGYLKVAQITNAIAINVETMFEAGAFSFLRREAWPDLVLHCDRFGFAFHSGIPADVVRDGPEWDRHFDRCVAAFRFMKRKFQEDLTSGAKIFVFRSTEVIADDQLNCLHSAIRARGPGWLLYVREDASVPPGSVRLIRDGLLIASVGRLSNENPPQIEFASWEKIARKALSIRYGGRGFPGMWRSPHAETNIALNVLPPVAGLDVLEHSISPHAHQEPVFHYYVADANPGETYTGKCWVLVPDKFKGRSVGLAMIGYPSLFFNRVNLEKRGIWQQTWVTARIPLGRRGLAPALIADSTVQDKLYTAGWELINGSNSK